MISAFMALASPVSPERARNVAQSVIVSSGGSGEAVQVQLPAEYNALYLFVADEGFVVLSSYDCVRPVLAYSPSGRFADTLPAHVADWLLAYNDEIDRLEKAGVEPSSQALSEWTSLEQGTPEEPLFSVVVQPLLTTTWKQGAPYNNLCPYDSSGSFRCVTGCVATAMAQVMRYWNHPVSGTGQHTYTHSSYGTLGANFGATTYQWSQMPASVSSASPTAQINAIATLMFHVGVALEMDYGRSSSATTGSYGSVTSVCAENALKTYFGYSRAMRHVEKADISDSLWSSMLMAELTARRPVMYSGRDVSAGHSFVCDGCDASGYFHFNWGWGGYCDGYYAIGALNPSPGGTGGTSSSTYNLKNGALLGIYPAATTHLASYYTTVASTDSQHGFVSAVGTHAYGDTVSILATTTAGYRFVRWTDGAPYNPRTVIVDSARSYTAVIEPIVHGCMASYAGTNYRTAISTGSGGNHHWGIKLEPADLAGQTALESVQVYDKGAGQHTLKIYAGGASSPQTLLYTKQFQLTNAKAMVDVVLDSLLPVDTTRPLWIVLNCSSMSYPAAATYFAGNDNSRWTSSNGTTWRALSLNYSYMVRAVFVDSRPCTVSATAEHGHVDGGGSYRAGQSATLTVVPDACHVFNHWSDGSTANPRLVVLAGDTVLYAVCIPVVVQGTERLSACDSLLWGDTVRRASGFYSRLTASADGCDSMVVLDLTVNHSARTVLRDTVRGSYSWNGQTLTHSGVYRDTLVTAEGCDSIVELMLTVYPASGIDGAEESALRVCPNPARSSVVVIAGSQVLETEILDLYGREVLRSNGPAVDVSAIAAGRYLLRVVTARGVAHAALLKL